MPLVLACQVGARLSSVQSGETESYGNSRARIRTESRERPPAVRNSIPEVLGARCGMQGMRGCLSAGGGDLTQCHHQATVCVLAALSLPWNRQASVKSTVSSEVAPKLSTKSQIEFVAPNSSE